MEIKQNDPAKAHEFFTEKIEFTTDPFSVSQSLKKKVDINVVDVRAAEDYAKGHVPGAINLPSDQWKSPAGLRKDAANVLYCYNQQCHLAALAAAEFSAQGFPVMEMDGGFEAWKQHDLEVETGANARANGKRQMAVSA
ncbi:MAG TPA: rhodanese-like domain-containing protein [Verrucomicrobiae bacterium]|nr:rhodanese-like domain-containing protein [Verrucomicrobiae bacterium]